MKEKQRPTIAEMKTKLGTQFDIVTEASVVTPAHLYTLNGEVVGWRAGNAAKRAAIGMGSGREAADIHYWITDQTREKLLDKKDIIRTEFWGSAFTGSVGQLVHPFAAAKSASAFAAGSRRRANFLSTASNLLYINDLEEGMASLQVPSSSFAFREMS